MISRREFAKTAALALPGSIAFPCASWARRGEKKPRRIAFTKPFQDDDFATLAARMKRLGFDGVELAVRPRGHIEPEGVEEHLPRAVEELRSRGLELSILTSALTSLDDPYAESTLRTAARLGVKRYRLGYYYWDRKRPMRAQLADAKAKITDLAALNAELGLQGLYQNHSGAAYIGAAIWDLHHLIEDLAVEHLGVAFDLGHATVEGGLSWPNHVRLLRPHFGAVYAKDFRWQDQKIRWCAFGTGKTAKSFYSELAPSGFTGPVSLHVEYGEGEDTRWHERAFSRDLDALDKLL